MFKKLKLKVKLMSAFLMVGIIPFAVLTVVALHQAGGALTNQAFNQMVGLLKSSALFIP